MQSMKQPQRLSSGPTSGSLRRKPIPIPGCAVCHKPLLTDTTSGSGVGENQNANVAEVVDPNQVLVTNCGHLYHLRCLESAFVHEKITLADRNLPSRRTCPYQSCLKDLSKTQLIKAHLTGSSGVASGGPNGNSVSFDEESQINQIKKLQAENTKLRMELQMLRDKDMTRVGEKVFVQNANGTYSQATVIELMVKVYKDSDSRDMRLDQQRSQGRPGSGFKDMFSNLIRESVVPLNKIILSKHFRKLATSANSDMKTRWCAGDRVFIPSEQKQATIKWIGSRDQSFMVLLEYEERISDEVLSDVGLPCTPKPYHCKMVYLNELNTMAEPAHEQRSRTPMSRFFRSTPLRRSASAAHP